MYSCTRQIGVDYGHRVMTHGSKCRSIHGHRGTIEATCIAKELHKNGEQQSMVIDFGFLKDAMMEVIDKSIDHGFIACIDDEEVLKHFILPKDSSFDNWKEIIREDMNENGFWLSTESHLDTIVNTKLYVVPFIPTSERLAEHFYNRLIPVIESKSDGLASLKKVKFWETPNCFSIYPHE